MLVGITELILNYRNRMFSECIGENLQVYSQRSNTIAYALTKQEQKRAEGLTIKLIEHIVMVKHSEDNQAINKNRSDIVTKFLEPIYTMCLKHGVPISNVLNITEDSKVMKYVPKNLSNKHNYKGVVDLKEILITLAKLTAACEINRARKIKWSIELGYDILEKCEI